MSRVGFSLLLLVVIVGLSRDVVRGAAPLRSVVRVDAYGDPLPTGVVARMGSVRFLHPQAWKVAYSRDGKNLITESNVDYRVWDPGTGRHVRGGMLPRSVVEENTNPDDWGWIPCPKGLAEVRWERGADNKTRLFLRNAKTRKDRQLLPGPLYSGQWIAFSCDGFLMAVPDGCDYDNPDADIAIHVWDLPKRKKISTLKGHGAGNVRPEFIPDTHLLFVQAGDRTRVWDVDQDKIHLALGPGSFQYLTATPHSLVVYRFSEGVDFWDLVTKRRKQTLVLPRYGQGSVEPGHDRPWNAALSPDEQSVALVGGSGRTTVWKLKTGKETSALACERFGADETAIAPDGKAVLGVWDQRRTVRVFETTTGLERFQLQSQGSILHVQFAAPGDVLLLERIPRAKEDSECVVSRYDVRSRKRLWTFRTQANDCRVTMSQGGTRIALGVRLEGTPNQGLLALLDGSSGKEVWRSKAEWTAPPTLAFDTSGESLAVVGTDAVRVLDAKTSAELFKTEPEKMPCPEALFCPRTGYLVLGGLVRRVSWEKQLLGQLAIWDWKAKRLHLRLEHGPSVAFQLAFAPGGGTLCGLFAQEAEGRGVGVRARRDSIGFELWDVEHRKRLLRYPQEKPRAPVFAENEQISYIPELHCVLRHDPRMAGPRLEELDCGSVFPGFGFAEGHTQHCRLFPDGRHLLLALSTGNLLVCKLLTREDRGDQEGPPISPAWDGLTDVQGYQAHHALCYYADNPADLLVTARRSLKPEPSRPKGAIARAMRDLDAADAATRKKAQADLQNWGRLALPELQVAEKSESAEVRRSARILLRVATDTPSKEELRDIRLMRLLVFSRVAGGTEILQSMAKGEPLGRRTQEAQRLLMLQKAVAPQGEATSRSD